LLVYIQPTKTKTLIYIKAFYFFLQIDSIRLVRDSATGMGKGFGYVNFVSVDSVETAIQRNGTELLGRAVRVNR
jgi:RNA recognition motif-containing protein